jgi:hypothetical protein
MGGGLETSSAGNVENIFFSLYQCNSLLCCHSCLLIHIGASRYMRNFKQYRDIN